MFTYRTYFELLAPVTDLDDAQEYLKYDDMATYLRNDDRINLSVRDSVKSITWILNYEDGGYIELETVRELSEEELSQISRWVSGQCSDGLGEGFEQQDFANYYIGEYSRDESYDDEENWVMAEFDWQTNDYIFELFSSQE